MPQTDNHRARMEEETKSQKRPSTKTKDYHLPNKGTENQEHKQKISTKGISTDRKNYS